jgi:hypothetical protein
MKKLLLLGLAIVLFTSCQEKGPERWTESSPEIDIAKTLIKDYEDGNWADWIGHYADTAKVHHNSIESISPQQMQDALKSDITNYGSYGFSHEEDDIFYEQTINSNGNKWVNFWGVWEGTMKNTDKKFVIPVHISLNFVNNLIVEEWAYYNRSAIDAALKEMAMAKEAAEVE